jgi:glycosyltransferase involved in cell wall biosynthesis
MTLSPILHDKPLSVLLVVHSLPPLESSGTPLIAHGYARHLAAAGIRTAVLYAAKSASRIAPPHNDMQHGFMRFEVAPTAQRWREWAVYDASRAAAGPSALRAVLDQFRPDLVHIVDLVNLPSEWVEEIKRNKIALLRQEWNAEDVCGMIEPIFAPSPQALCAAPITPEQCASCCLRQRETPSLRKAQHPQLVRALARKRERALRDFGERYDQILFPTASFRAFFERTLPLAAARTAVVEPGIELPAGRNAAKPAQHALVRFVFLGQMDLKKGAQELVEVFTSPELVQRKDYELHIHGREKADAAALFAANPRVRHFGPYEAARLPSILVDCDVGLSPSRFESFHRVTREYLCAGLPVLASRAFGIPEVVRDEENGLLFDVADVEAFKRCVLTVLDNRALLHRLAEGARTTPLRALRDEVDDLVRCYRAMIGT